MPIEFAGLSTHLALVTRRLRTVGPNDSANTFLTTSYVAESAIKTIAITLYAGLRDYARDHAYRQAYSLLRADGFGSWDQAVREMTTAPVVSFFPPDLHPLIAWLTKKRTQPDEEWFREAWAASLAFLKELGVEEKDATRPATIRDLISALVQIRNKTKAHGAVGPDFFEVANPNYIKSVAALVTSCPALGWKWMHLSRRDKGNIRGVLLRGSDPTYMRDAESLAFNPAQDGIYYFPNQGLRAFYCGDLLRTNKECTNFFIPNGAFREGSAEFLNYATGDTRLEDVAQFVSVPAALPTSETHGLESFDVQSNVFGNLPPLMTGYVERKALQTELIERLLDKNHPIITLHGRGGAGKTSLALYAAHELSRQQETPFEYVVWFSARDVDLRPTGPTTVRPRVIDLGAVSKTFGTLFQREPTVDSFASILRSPAPLTSKGILFIFDNFETMAEVTALHRFLDTHTHLPNKILLTSRERAFKADYPIEVRGMEFAEASTLMRRAAAELSIAGLLTEKIIKDVYEYTEGHAYVMRVIIGELAKERKYNSPKHLMSQRADTVNAVFERSFSKLTESGRWVFLAVANWRSSISEIALLVVIGQRGLDVGAGIEECLRLSMITRDLMADGQPSYFAPQLARVFGRKKLDGDPDRLALQEDLNTLQHFGVLDIQDVEKKTHEEQIKKFIAWCLAEAAASPDKRQILDSLLESTALLWPKAWLDLATMRMRSGGERERISQALRRAVEENPFDKKAWLARAKYAESISDDPTRIAALVSAVDADPRDVPLIRETAFQLCKYVNVQAIPKTRRGVYLASVRTHMEAVASQLDATGLSRLAWLFLLEEDEAKARKFAELGAEKEPENRHCQGILDRLDQGKSYSEFGNRGN